MLVSTKKGYPDKLTLNEGPGCLSCSPALMARKRRKLISCHLLFWIEKPFRQSSCCKNDACDRCWLDFQIVIEQWNSINHQTYKQIKKAKKVKVRFGCLRKEDYLHCRLAGGSIFAFNYRLSKDNECAFVVVTTKPIGESAMLWFQFGKEGWSKIKFQFRKENWSF